MLNKILIKNLFIIILFLGVSNADYTQVTENVGLVSSAGTQNATGAGYRQAEVLSLWQEGISQGGGIYSNGNNFYSVLAEVIPPVAVSLKINNNAVYTIFPTVNLQTTATDATSGVARMQFSNDGGTWSAWLIYSTGTVTWNLSAGNGTKNVYVRFIDNDGNTSNPISRQIIYDAEVPGLPTVIPSYAQWTSKNAYFTLADGTVGVSGIKVREYSFDSVHWINYTGSSVNISEDGEYIIYARVINNSGNTSNIALGFLNIDKTSPGITVTGNRTAWGFTDVVLNISGSDSLSGVHRMQFPDGTWLATANITYRVSANGRYDFAVLDRAGNTNNQTVYITKIDKVLPLLSITGNPIAWQNINATLNISASDALSGLHDITLPSGLSISANQLSHVITKNGLYKFIVRDKALNVVSQSILVTRVDKDLPTVTDSGNPLAWQQADVFITVSATDNAGSGIKRVRRINGSWNTTDNISFTVKNNGAYTCLIEDNVGNVRWYTVTVNRIDKISPTGIITGNINNWTNQPILLTCLADDPLSGVSRIKIPDGSWVTGDQATYLVTVNGQYAFLIEDNVSNTAEVKVVIDKLHYLKPGTPNIYCATGWQKNYTVRLKTELPDPSGNFWRLEYKINAGGWQLYTTTLNYTTEGVYTLYARTVDLAGNSSSENSVLIQVDHTPPAMPGIHVSTANWTINDVTVSVTSIPIDSLSGLRKIEYSIGSGGWLEYTATLTITQDCDTTIRFRAVDIATNNSVENISTIKIDKTHPEVKDIDVISLNKPISSVRDLNIILRDEGIGISLNTLEIVMDNIVLNPSINYNYVNVLKHQVRVISKGVKQNGFNVTITQPNSKEYAVKIIPLAGFEYDSTIQLAIDLADKLKNSINAVYTFYVMGSEGRELPAIPIAYPTIFDPGKQNTKIYFALKEPRDVTVRIYDLSGNQVWAENCTGKIGDNYVEWNGEGSWTSHLGNGIYVFYITEGPSKKVLGRGKIIIMRE